MIKSAICILGIVVVPFVVAIDLEVRSLLDGKVEMKIPTDFIVMPDEMLSLKYPAESKPTVVYTDESGGINVALNLTENPADQGVVTAYKDNIVGTFKRLYPSAVWISEGVETIDYRQVGFLEFVTPAVDTEIYNLMFLTDVNGSLLLCTFNCTRKSMEEWTPTAKEIMRSLTVK